MNKKSLSRKDLEEYANDSAAFSGLDILKISSIFIAQVYRMEMNRVINVFSVTDEIKFLEGVKKSTATGNATQFRGHLLKGLYKKHFMDASFIRKNIHLEMGRESGKTDKIKKIINEAFKRNTSGYLNDEFINYISYHTTVGTYDERAKKSLTGEWIVFQKHNNSNYYLTMAAHDEGDERILSRVVDVYNFDYPFLKKMA